MLRVGKDLQSPTNNFPRTCRLRGRSAFEEIVKNGNKLRGNVFKLSYVKENPTRFGISVSKRRGGAVERNRLKRMIREFLRQNKWLWPENRWVMIKLIKKPINKTEIAEDLKRLLEKIK